MNGARPDEFLLLTYGHIINIIFLVLKFLGIFAALLAGSVLIVPSTAYRKDMEIQT